MPTKCGRKEPEEPPLTPYEAYRLSQCMQNNAILQQLGLGEMPCFKRASIPSKKHKSQHRNLGDSESEYEPENYGADEDDFVDDNQSKKSENTSKKASNNRSATLTGPRSMPGVKRVHAVQSTTRATRSKRLLTLQDVDQSNVMSDPTCLTPAAIPTAGTPSATSEQHRQAIVQDDGLHHQDQPNQMPTEECSHTTLLDNQMSNVGDVAHTDHEVSTDNDCEEQDARCIRGINMGKGLQKLSRARRGKLPVVIPEGRIRPVVPLVAAKFATECNIAVRNHVPVFTHWKEYKKQPGIMKHYLGKLDAKFDINTSNATIEKACVQMMKSALRQQRYRLKKKYFNPYPLHLVLKNSPIKCMTDDEWNDLVEYWKNPRKMATCETNKANRAQVKFHQTTGSRSYMVHLENLGQDKYKDVDPNALDLFKDFHYSKKKKGYTPLVQSGITEMENKISEPTEDGQPKCVTEVVADFLAQHTKKSKFLQNVGMQNVPPRSGNLEAQLEAAKRVKAGLQELVATQQEQIHTLSVQAQEAEQERVKDKEEMEKKLAETNAKLELLLSHA